MANLSKMALLDTNILLLGPEWEEHFKGYTIIVPNVLIEELDKHKNDLGAIGFNSRRASKYIGSGSLTESTTFEGYTVSVVDGTHFVFIGNDYIGCDSTTNDLKFVNIAANMGIDLYSQDNNVHLLALGKGVIAKHYDYANVTHDDIYLSHKINVTEEQLAKFYSSTLTPQDLGIEAVPNKYLEMLCGDQKVLAVIRGKTIVHFVEHKNRKSDVKPLITEHKFLQSAISNPEIKVINVIGVPGSGKTLTTLSTCHSLLNSGHYDKIYIVRPLEPVGKTVGYLKGTLEDKLAPFKSIYSRVLEKCGVELERAERFGQIEFITPEFIRGETFDNSLIVVDECQNLSVVEVKTLITRISSSSKIILLGDVSQVDNRFLTEYSNGLAIAAEKLKNFYWNCNIYINKSVRAEFINDAVAALNGLK